MVAQVVFDERLGMLSHLSRGRFGHLYMSFGEVSVEVLCPFSSLFFVLLLLLLNCGDSLHILGLRSLPDMGNVQSPSVGCLVTLLMCLWTAAQL